MAKLIITVEVPDADPAHDDPEEVASYIVDDEDDDFNGWQIVVESARWAE